MVTTTKKINLAQLDKELNGTGLNMDSKEGTHIITAVDESITEAQLQATVDAHLASEDAQPTITEKLASVGLSVDDLKAALGL